MAIDLHMLRPSDVLASSDTCLVDLVDSILDQGVVIRGELWLSVAEVDLVFHGVDLVLRSQTQMQQERAGG